MYPRYTFQMRLRMRWKNVTSNILKYATFLRETLPRNAEIRQAKWILPQGFSLNGLLRMSEIFKQQHGFSHRGDFLERITQKSWNYR